MNKKYSDWLKIVVVVAGLYLASKMTAIYLPVLLAVVLTFILNPAVDFLARIRPRPDWSSFPRGLAVLLTMLLFALVVVVLLSLIFTPFVLEFNRFITNLPSIAERIQRLSGVLQQHTNELALPRNIQSVLDMLLSSSASYAVGLGQRIMDILLGVATQVVALVVVPVLTFYFLKDWRILRESCIDAMPPAARDKSRIIVHEMAAAMSSYLHGQAKVSIIIGLLVFSGMYFLGVDYPLVLGLLATLTETIPIIGPIIGATPAILLAYLAAPGLAAKVVLFYLAIHQIENHIVVPKIMGNTIDLHPVTVIIALLVGGQLFGVVGMIVAVPAVALLKVLFKQLWHYN